MDDLSREEKRSIIAAILVIVIGYLIAMFTCEDIFPRSGAVVVCIGVYFAAQGFILHSGSFESVAEELRKENLENSIRILDSRRGEITDEQVNQSKNLLLAKEKEIENEAQRKIYHLKLRLLRVESTLTIVGTLIWAFGDWMVFPVSFYCEFRVYPADHA